MKKIYKKSVFKGTISRCAPIRNPVGSGQKTLLSAKSMNGFMTWTQVQQLN